MDKNMFYLHEDRLDFLLEKDGTSDEDLERQSLFYIISGSLDLYCKAEYIYNFEKRIIKKDCLESVDVDFCGSSRALVKLAFNLFNGFRSKNDDVLSIFSLLDDDNFNIAKKAISLRFDRDMFNDLEVFVC